MIFTPGVEVLAFEGMAFASPRNATAAPWPYTVIRANDEKQRVRANDERTRQRRLYIVFGPSAYVNIFILDPRRIRHEDEVVRKGAVLTGQVAARLSA